MMTSLLSTVIPACTTAPGVAVAETPDHARKRNHFTLSVNLLKDIDRRRAEHVVAHRIDLHGGRLTDDIENILCQMFKDHDG